MALDGTIMVFAFAPIVAFLLGLLAITVPWDTLVLSVVLHIVVPVIAAQILRRSLLARGGDAALAKLLGQLQPASSMALLATLVLLLGFQSRAALATVVGVLIEVPVMLSVVWIVNRSKDWYERGAGARG